MSQRLLRSVEASAFASMFESDQFDSDYMDDTKQLLIRDRTGSVTAIISGKRRSGDSWTSAGNGLLNLAIQALAVRFSYGLDVLSGDIVILVEGDDAEIHVPMKFWTPLGLARYKSFISSCGVVPEVTISRPIANQDIESGLPPSEFCSTHLVVLNDGPVVLPTFKRAFSRLFFSTRVGKNDSLSQARAGALSALAIGGELPVFW